MSNKKTKSDSERTRRSGIGWLGGVATGVAAVGAAALAYVEYKAERNAYDRQLMRNREDCVNEFVSQQYLNASVGDMIEIQRKNYSHWALYVGNGMCVHLNIEENASQIKYMLSSLQEVTNGCKCRVNNQEMAAKERGLVARDVNDILELAYSKLGAPEPNYHVFDNNCETFVTWCRYGTGFSLQGSAIEGKPLIETFAPVVNEVLKVTAPLNPSLDNGMS